MATFQIHEDIENYHHHALPRAKNKNAKGGQENKIVSKKCNLEKRVILQQMNNNGTRQEVKRIKLTATTKEIVKDVREAKVEVEEKIAIEPKEPVIENSFIKFQKENEISDVEENEKECFSQSLLHNDEYRKDIWDYLQEMEFVGPRPKSNYMLKQVDLNWTTRSVLVDWLVTVANEYKFCDETFHLSINYIDRFLSQISVVRNKFQLLGAAAMMLATKMEEYQPIDAREWAYLTGDTFTPRQVLKMEQIIMKVLKFKMQTPTIHVFIQHLCTEHKMDAKIVNLAMYISELVLLEGEDYLNHFPSKLAAAAIALARYTLTKQKPWPEKLKKASGYTLKELSPVVQRQHRTFKESPMKEQQAIQTKYKSDKYNKVALLKPKLLMLDILEDEE